MLLSNLLTGDTFMPKFYLIQRKFIYSACEMFTNSFNWIQKFRETGNLKHIYNNELDKACFVHDAVYSDGRNLDERTISDNILQERAN